MTKLTRDHSAMQTLVYVVYDYRAGCGDTTQAVKFETGWTLNEARMIANRHGGGAIYRYAMRDDRTLAEETLVEVVGQ